MSKRAYGSMRPKFRSRDPLLDDEGSVMNSRRFNDHHRAESTPFLGTLAFSAVALGPLWIALAVLWLG